MFQKELAGKMIAVFGINEGTKSFMGIELSTGANFLPFKKIPQEADLFIQDVKDTGMHVDGVIFINPSQKEKKGISKLHAKSVPAVIVEEAGASDESRLAISELHAIDQMAVIFALRHHQEGKGLELAAKKMAKLLG